MSDIKYLFFACLKIFSPLSRSFFSSIQTPLNSPKYGGSFRFSCSPNYLPSSPVSAVSVFFFLFSFIQVSPLAVQFLLIFRRLLHSNTQCHHSPDQAARGPNVLGRSTLVSEADPPGQKLGGELLYPNTVFDC